jgi:hypothetical protein
MSNPERGSFSQRVTKRLTDIGVETSQVVSHLTSFEEAIASLPKLRLMGAIYRDIGAVRPFLNITIGLTEALDMENSSQAKILDKIGELHSGFAFAVSDPKGSPSGFDTSLDFISDPVSIVEFQEVLIEQAFEPTDEGLSVRKAIVLGYREFMIKD